MAITDAKPSTRRVLIASLVGTSVEFYDFYIYATAASLVFGPLFFPAESPSAQLLSAYASLGLAFLARPLGAWLFGHYGDRIGRKSTLVASLLLMGASTTLIAFLPTYQMIGWVAPLLLCILRFGQGIGLGGEWGGAALLAVENAPPHLRGRFGMFPQLGAPVGFIAANGLFLVLGLWLTPQEFLDWGWRLPFLGSAVLVALGLWVRLKLTETPAFRKAIAEAEPPKVPIAELFREHLGPTFAGTFAAIACFATYYLATAFALGYATKSLGVPKETFLSIQIVAILFMALGIALAGWWSDVKSARYVLIAGCVGTIATGALLGPMFVGGLLPLIAGWLVLALFMMGFVYGPLGAFLPSLFPPRVRYTGASMTFNIAGILGAAPVPLVAQWLADRGGLAFVGYYLSLSAAVSLFALWWSRHHDKRAMAV
ncbi:MULTISPECIES: MFS transporter [unclassified Sphingomonas]|uniref:MFS transporter n=1 Tax=unclassified Sphingomonas TaxID=196159 RepID=UPI0006FBB652|nr:MULTISPECIES: MFS transporter [unclassified Sphingomonas]KQX26322.1 MFS transporter [Sphingomonas sp. Root1294]KQY69393.1 MFS transporter [Sphingomonas sp. Root50]KRB89651.1 MFS transporter [Sphingomonas sp. Root720]